MIKRSAMTVLLISIVLAGLAGPTSAQFGKNKISYVPLEWRYVETEHFNVYYYRGAEYLVPEVIELAEEAYRHHRDKLNWELQERVPFIMYRNKREFQQTNILIEDISEGIGGFAEILHNRMVLPVDGSKETVRRLVYHELTHIFQYEIIFHNVLSQALNRVPDWFIEGMAAHMEGTWDSFGLMVLRDAVLNDTLLSLQDLHNFYAIRNPFLGYRIGQSAVDFIVDKWGYRGLQRLLWEMSKNKTKDMKQMIRQAFDISYQEFDDQWQTQTKERFWAVGVSARAPLDIGTMIRDDDRPRYERDQYFQSSLSPSGDIVAVFSTGRGELDISLITADKGHPITNLTKNYQGRKYETLLGYALDEGRSISWSPDGRLLAFVAKKEGRDIIFRMNALDGRIVDELDIPLNNISSPVFSADGFFVYFAGYDMTGQSDIFRFGLNSGSVERLTNDAAIDLFPAISPDGQQLIYSTERDGVFQLAYLYLLDEPQPLLLTMNSFNSLAPSWNSDGKRIIFIADDQAVYNIFELDLSESKMHQLTTTYTGFFNPHYSPDDKKIYFDTFYKAAYHIGFIDPEQIADMVKTVDYVVPTTPRQAMGESVEPANVSAPVTAGVAVDNSAENNDRPNSEAASNAPSLDAETTSAAESYEESQHPGTLASTAGNPDGLPITVTEPETVDSGQESETSEQTGTQQNTPGEGETQTAEEPVQHAETETGASSEEKADDPRDLIAFLGSEPETVSLEGKKVRFKLLPDGGFVEGGYRTDGLIIGRAVVQFSDILGDHRFIVAAESISDESSLFASYYNLKRRINWGIAGYDTRDYTYFYDESRNRVSRYSQNLTGVEVFAEYPFDRYHRVEMSISRSQFSIEGYPVFNTSTQQVVIVPDYVKQINPIGISFIRDTIRYRYFGPYMGSAVRLGISKAIGWSDSYYDYLDYSYDLRSYQRVSARTLLATRLVGLFSTGSDQGLYGIGGGSTLRGYDWGELIGNNYGILNVEYRFPLVDIILIPFLGAFTNIRGAFYWDSGIAWFKDEDITLWEQDNGFRFVDVKSSLGFGIYWNIGYFELRFDWARPTDLQGYTGDWRYQFSIGRSF